MSIVVCLRYEDPDQAENLKMLMSISTMDGDTVKKFVISPNCFVLLVSFFDLCFQTWNPPWTMRGYLMVLCVDDLLTDLKKQLSLFLQGKRQAGRNRFMLRSMWADDSTLAYISP